MQSNTILTDYILYNLQQHISTLKSHLQAEYKEVYIYIYVCVCVCGGGPGSSAGIATDYGLDGPG